RPGHMMCRAKHEGGPETAGDPPREESLQDSGVVVFGWRWRWVSRPRLCGQVLEVRAGRPPCGGVGRGAWDAEGHS
ncbi:hypothetical protein OJ252_649, partial [Cryptosporidium canis]